MRACRFVQELGRPIGEVFETLQPQAAASASLAQVYRGVLLTGEEVAVKVQRPDALPTVARDLVILRRGIEYYQNTLSQMASGFTNNGASSDDIVHLLR